MSLPSAERARERAYLAMVEAEEAWQEIQADDGPTFPDGLARRWSAERALEHARLAWAHWSLVTAMRRANSNSDSRQGTGPADTPTTNRA